MQITTAALLTTLVAAPMAVMADSCDKDTSCKYWDELSWTNAVEKFCDPADNRVVKQGDSFEAKTSKNDDGAGGAQIFSGSYEVTGQKQYTIHNEECSSYMSQIFAKCGGYGGSIDTGFGTVTAACITDASADKPWGPILDDDRNMPQPGLNSVDRRKRNNAAIRVKKLQDNQAKAELKQHKEDESAKQKEEEEAKIHEEHQTVAEGEDAKAAQGTMSRRAAEDEAEDESVVPEDEAEDESVTKQTDAGTEEDKTAEEAKIHEEHEKVAAEEDAKAAENQKVADADAAKISSRDDSMAESKVDEEAKIHADHEKVAADEDNKILDNLKLAQQAGKFVQVIRRDDQKNVAKVDADQKHEDASQENADAKTQEDKAAEEAKIQAEHDKVAADEKTKEDQKAAEDKKQMDDKAAEDAKIKSQTAQ